MIPAYCPRCGTELGERRIDGRSRKWCRNCERPVFRNAVPCADVTVVDGDRVLLVERAVPPDAGSWTIPGGHLEVEEDPREAAVRELQEETGLRVNSAALALLEATQLDVVDGKHVVSTAYAARAADVSGTPTAKDDAAAVEWVDRDRVEDRWTRPHVARRVAAAVEEVR